MADPARIPDAQWRNRWMSLLATTVMSLYFYLAMEWLFFVTKPSFLSSTSFSDSLLTIAVSPVFPIVASAGVIAVLGGLGAAVGVGRFRRLLLGFGRCLPALILASSFFLLIDNFSYTIFSLGVVSSKGVLPRFGYALLFIALLVVTFRRLSRIEEGMVQSSGFRALALIMISLTLAGTGVRVHEAGGVAAAAADSGAVAGELPDIFLLGSDGVRSNHMSVYGYERDTTPFLAAFAEEALVLENNFANSSNTGGSIISMLVGRLPTHTRLVFPPDILSGEDVYRHLPGRLRRLGYESIAINQRHYADPYDLNMRNSFDVANARSIDPPRLPFLSGSVARRFNLEQYFLTQVFERIRDRVFHVSGLREMVDAYDEVTDMKKERGRDDERLRQLLEFVDAADAPIFAHVHFLGTHGRKFDPERRIFSKGKVQSGAWMVDFYDDAIYNADQTFEAIVEHLRRAGRLESSIIVINSDHGMNHASSERVPMIIRFPGGKHRGRRAVNTSNADVAPTVLDYLGLDVPEWMDGDSLLGAELDPLRPVITVTSNKEKHRRYRGWRVKPRTLTPIEGLQSISALICQRRYTLNTLKRSEADGTGPLMRVEDIAGHTAPCSAEDLPGEAEVTDFLLNHLDDAGYDLAVVGLTPPE